MYTVREEGLSGKVDDLIKYLIVMYYDKNFAAASVRVTHRKCLQATITFLSKVRGVNFITSTKKFARFRCGKYCTIYHSTLYAHP